MRLQVPNGPAAILISVLLSCSPPEREPSPPSEADLHILWESPDQVSAAHSDHTILPSTYAEFLRRFAIMPLRGRESATVQLGAMWEDLSSAERLETLEVLTFDIHAAGFTTVRFAREGRLVHHSDRTKSPGMFDGAADHITARADRQGEAADLYIWVASGMKLALRRPKREKISLEELRANLASHTDKRDLAVIVLAKFSPINDSIEDLYTDLTRLGFRKVVIQFARGWGRVIFRE